MSFSTYISKAILFILIGLTLLILSCKDEETTAPQNQKPQIQSLSANPSTIKVNDETTLTCVATDPDGDNLTVSWTAPSGTFPNGNVGTSVKWKAPNNIGVYSITATVSDGKDTDKEVVSVNVEAAGTAPSAPTLSSPSNSATDVAIPPTLSWNSSSGATSYTLQVSINSNFTSFVYNQSGLTGTSQQVSGLNNSTQYYWRVSATNSYGTSGWSSVWNFSGGFVPDTPTLSLPVNGITNLALPLSLVWNASIAANTYKLQISKESNFSNLVYEEGGIQGTIAIINELSDNTLYYWRVSASNNYGTSEYSSTWSFKTPPNPFNCGENINYEGVTYSTVKIGTQCWIKENINIGIMINSNQDQINNGIIEKYCYDNNPTNCNIYGGLYQWDEAMRYVTTPGYRRGICPNNWLIPTEAEFNTLAGTVGNDGNALKSIGQGTGNGSGTNTSGFSALLAGYRQSDSTFQSLYTVTIYWSSTPRFYYRHAVGMELFGSSDDIYIGTNIKSYGISVRCVTY